jgi:hypothetical protein
MSGQRFETILTRPEEASFYKSILGVMWTWVRLIVLRGNSFNIENYQRDIAQMFDAQEYEHHELNQGTVEAIDFTFNAIKYAQKIGRKESLGGFSFPLNYTFHQRLLPVYLSDDLDRSRSKDANSFLASNF